MLGPKPHSFLDSEMRSTLALLLTGISTLAAAAEQPHILFAIADDVSYPHMGAYGTDFEKEPSSLTSPVK